MALISVLRIALAMIELRSVFVNCNQGAEAENPAEAGRRPEYSAERDGNLLADAALKPAPVGVVEKCRDVSLECIVAEPRQWQREQDHRNADERLHENADHAEHGQNMGEMMNPAVGQVPMLVLIKFQQFVTARIGHPYHPSSGHRRNRLVALLTRANAMVIPSSEF